MIVIEVLYNLEIPQIGFNCPFCKTLQTRPGGHMIDMQMYPNPKEVVEAHLKGEGEPRCEKFNSEIDSAEELQITSINLTS